jgi:hypothetical protein
MRKTNIQIDGYFIGLEKNKYYKSDISDLDKWKSLEVLPDDMKDNDITEELKGYMNSFGIFHSVNFLTSQSGG